MALGAVSTPSKTWVPPVGMIITTGSPTSPAEIYDGTSWARITDRFLIGAGESYSLGSTGGSATHTLTVAEMPAHSHSATVLSAGEHSHTVTSYYDTGSVSMTSDYDYTGDNDDYRLCTQQTRHPPTVRTATRPPSAAPETGRLSAL